METYTQNNGQISNKLKKISSALKYLFELNKPKKVLLKIISEILSYKDILAILPTGYGKSICYIVAGVLSDRKTLVISPLLQLMNEQARFINSRMGNNYAVVLSDLKNDKVEKINNAKFVFTSPEKLVIEQETLAKFEFQNFIVDEAHCISFWSNDFRPAYSKISKVIKKLTHTNEISLLGLTATADKHIKKDIIRSIPFREDFKTYNKPCFRKNISIYTVNTNGISNKLLHIAYYLSRLEFPGIIYCPTKNCVEIVFKYIEILGYNVQKYHSALSKIKDEVLERYLNNDNLITVTTNALGLGLNKRNLRFVIHFSIPSCPEIYLQEIGRSGRDDLCSSAILLYDKQDKVIQEYLINKSKPSVRKYKKVHRSLNRIEGRSVSLVSYISNVGIKECKVILDCLKSIKIVRKRGNLYYKTGKFDIEKLYLSDKIRLRKTQKLEMMKKYAELNPNINKWEWLLKYLGYKILPSKLDENNFYTNDWIEQPFDKNQYNSSVDEFINNYNPLINKGKNHQGGFALSFYSDSLLNRTKLGEDLYNTKYGSKKNLENIWVEKASNLITKSFTKNIDYICLCPSFLNNDFMKNFAEELSFYLNKNGFSIVLHNVIERCKGMRPQKNMKTPQRKVGNIRNSFYIDEKHYQNLKDKSAILLDDIYDSGATVEECSKVLREMGIKKIFIFTLTKTFWL